MLGELEWYDTQDRMQTQDVYMAYRYENKTISIHLEVGIFREKTTTAKKLTHMFYPWYLSISIYDETDTIV